MGGFFGTISTKPCITDLFYGTDYNSHLGTKRAGLATYSEDKGFFRSIHSLESSYFRTRFESELDTFEGNSGIGIISDTDPQPIMLNTHLGKMAIVTVARINNLEELAKELLEGGDHFSEMTMGRTNPTELIALLITKGASYVEGIQNVFCRIKGSCSMLILTENGIIAARDRLGRTPIVIGRRGNDWAISSESTSFPNLGYETERFLGPAEIVRITTDGVEVLSPAGRDMQVCSFLWVYYGFPTSTYEGRNVESVRHQCGYLMGQQDKTPVDSVSGIPDSGVGMATGYAEGMGVPFRRAISKYTPTWPRSFMPGNQAMRDLVAKMKLIPNKDMLEGKRCLFCDDSIVRGTQLHDNVRGLFELGAREVHMRIACPPLIYGCPFLNFSASKSDMELITRQVIHDLEHDDDKTPGGMGGSASTPNEILQEYARTDSAKYCAMVEEIGRRLGLTSLRFNTVEILIKSIGLPKEQVCTHCFDGSSRD